MFRSPSPGSRGPAPLLPALLALLLLAACREATREVVSQTANTVQGEAMGSYYRITYLGDAMPGLTGAVDSLLDDYNQELSAWVADSKLSQFNRSDSGVDLRGTRHFLPNLALARAVSERTDGSYDPTVAPLVAYWGFGTGQPRTTASVDTAEVARLRELVGLDHLELRDSFLRKDAPGVQLDLNASAKGYGVDLISALLTAHGRPDHLVDVGGEMRAGGTKNGRPWTVGIRLPEEDASRIRAAGTLPLAAGRAIATSGNYLNYYRVDGATFSHTIDPRTGLVERNALLSASVLAPDCATADAYATACMVLGPGAALRLVNADPALEGYFLVRAADSTLQTVVSRGLR